MKKIYIITTYTGTALSYLIKKTTKESYAHVSIALDKELNEMYSFGRKRTYHPFLAGLVKEDINSGLYKIKPNTTCRIYSLEIDDDTYELVKYNIGLYWNRKDEFKYDAIGLIYMRLNRSRKRRNGYVCSTFVADVLNKSNINLFDKPFYAITPKEFLECKGLMLEYEGLLRESNLRCCYV